MKPNLLIVEDDTDMAGLLVELARGEGFSPQTAPSAEDAEPYLAGGEVDALFTDLRLPGSDGLALLARARRDNPHLPVVLITGYATPMNTIEAFRAGVTDVILKPFETGLVRLALRRIGELLAHRARIRQLAAAIDRYKPRSLITSNAPAMQKALALAAQVAPTPLPVLLQGETGVGKGVFAEHIHALSPRADKPHLALHCGAIAENLLESELFGHEKGAFSGAVARKPGLLELAAGGTLFLDEINSASLELQTRLLRFIQDKRLFRVGGVKPIEVDVRLIFASNQDLKVLVSEGHFREDLFYRLSVFPIEIPPLRKRREDIRPLAEYLLLRHAPLVGKAVNEITPEALAALERYPWPGNVRELENVIQRAIVLSGGTALAMHDLPADISQRNGGDGPRCPWGETATLAEVERFWIEQVLKRCGGNRTHAAQQLGIDPSTLWRKLKDGRG